MELYEPVTLLPTRIFQANVTRIQPRDSTTSMASASRVYSLMTVRPASHWRMRRRQSCSSAPRLPAQVPAERRDDLAIRYRGPTYTVPMGPKAPAGLHRPSGPRD